MPLLVAVFDPQLAGHTNTAARNMTLRAIVHGGAIAKPNPAARQTDPITQLHSPSDPRKVFLRSSIRVLGWGSAGPKRNTKQACEAATGTLQPHCGAMANPVVKLVGQGLGTADWC